ncbi:SIN3-HDAC complex-associated factor [Acropora cervicornis]|uniref:SIN3-HDAC complex-associated factor n=1 Tax=Acropora cervicornis TaxID=6130 RepID=A0AAD9R487_ACRCE|nr:PREDICTED: protein FAM60A-like [Acropora digitifera]XP_015762615.1 PREDICTED: protein FAM60A-like [Acropora digitifera]KAK2572848.1 SIN3-HDAC complex-associated factor [Acropora cervicornis]
MFASHRPRVFRSRLGCCICGAKSSSSRFTSSTKYELLFSGCFLLSEERQGEICNACVLLVKRWKKLPPGSSKNWKHVVDSKATVKKTTKPRRSSRTLSLENEKDVTTLSNGRSTSGRSNSSRDEEELETDSGGLSPTLMCASPSPSASDVSDEFPSGSIASHPVKRVSTASQTSFLFPSLTSSANNKLPFIDLSTWRREEICCGTIFRGPYGEVLVDPKLLNSMCTCSSSARPPVTVGQVKSAT